MLKRSLVLVAMSAGLMAPAFAQQTTQTGQQPAQSGQQAAHAGQQATQQQRQAAQTLNDKYTRAYNKQDANGIGSLYADDGIVVGESPNVLDGRQAIDRQLADDFRKGTAFTNLAAQVKEVRPLGDNMILVIGTWEADPAQPAVAQGAPTGQPTQQAQNVAPQAQSGSSQPPAGSRAGQARPVHGMWTAVEEIQGPDAVVRLLTYNIISPDEQAAAMPANATPTSK